MNKLEFSKDSWHYWFIMRTTRYLSDLRFGDKTPDICGYTRAFILGSIKTLILGTIFGLAAFVTGSAIALGLSLLFKWHLPILIINFGKVGTVVIACGASIFTLAGTAAGIATIRDKISDHRAGKAPGALRQMYRSWKEKTCSQIEFK